MKICTVDSKRKKTLFRFLLKYMKINYSIIIAYFSLIFLFFSFSVILYMNETNAEISTIKQVENQNIVLNKEIVFNELSLIYSDILVLSERQSIQEFLRIDSADNRQVVAEQFLNLANFTGLYDQVRLLDETGMEVIRVNYNYSNPFIVPESDLQNKSRRYYFEDAFSLDKGQVFVSPLDLNIEFGEIEQPLKPMIRIGTPVFDSNNSKRGIVLVNYLAKLLLDKLTDSSYGNIALLNSDGYWLLGIDPEDEWGFMYPSDNTKLNSSLSHQQPQAWDKINKSMSGQFYAEEGLLTFDTIYPLSDIAISSTGSGRPFEPSNASIAANEYSWKIMSIVPNRIINNNRNLLLFRYIFFLAIVLIISSVAFFILLFINTRRKITEQRQLIALAEQKEELHQANIKLKELDHLKSLFLASMSHELRTPLNSIIGFTGWLLMGMEGDLSEEQTEQLSAVRTSANHLLDLINDILDISKIEAGKVDLVIEKLEIAEVVDEVLSSVLPSVEDKGLKLISNVPEGIILTSDKRRVKQILMNLTSNAIKFTYQGDVKIEVRPLNNKDLEFVVSDSGIGIKKEDLGTLFQPFQQIDMSTTRKYKGTGLGLYLCKKLLEILNGDISVTSEFGKGSEFKFTLPLKTHEVI